jgi:uncharacterized protein YybS (DUF2232 family)
MEQWIKTQPVKTAQQKQAVERATAQLNEFRAHPVEFVWVVLPMGVFMLGSVFTWLNYMLCRWILPRFGHAVPQPTPFGEFRLPAALTWGFVLISLGATYLAGPLLNAPWWAKLLANISGPLMFIFVLVGMAVAYGFLRKKELSKPLAVGFTLAGLFLPGGLGPTVYMMLAMWDAIFDFRGLGHGLWKRPTETP